MRSWQEFHLSFCLQPMWLLVAALVQALLRCMRKAKGRGSDIFGCWDFFNFCHGGHRGCTHMVFRFGTRSAYSMQQPLLAPPASHAPDPRQFPCAAASILSTVVLPSHPALPAQAGAIPLLAQLLTSGSRSTREAAARALSNLVVNSEANKVEVVRFGAIHSLVRMLESESEFSREAAAAALANLAANSEGTQGAIARAGAIPALVAALRHSTPAAQQHAARALRNLAGRDNANKLRSAEAGAIPLLVDLMRDGPAGDAACQAAAASALSAIASNCEETQLAVAQAGALPVLCTLLESVDMPCREAAAWALSNLAACGEVRTHVPVERVAAPLVALLSSPGGEHGRQGAARALKSLSAGPSNSSKVGAAQCGMQGGVTGPSAGMCTWGCGGFGCRAEGVVGPACPARPARTPV